MASTSTVNGILTWLGITNPNATETALVALAADNAEYEIKTIRQQDYDDDIEEKYIPLAIEMGVYLYQKRGIDGVTSMTENDISRVYEKGSFPPSMLRRITPKCSIRFVHSDDE